MIEPSQFWLRPKFDHPKLLGRWCSVCAIRVSTATPLLWPPNYKLWVCFRLQLVWVLLFFLGGDSAYMAHGICVHSISLHTYLHWEIDIFPRHGLFFRISGGLGFRSISPSQRQGQLNYPNGGHRPNSQPWWRSYRWGPCTASAGREDGPRTGALSSIHQRDFMGRSWY